MDFLVGQCWAITSGAAAYFFVYPRANTHFSKRILEAGWVVFEAVACWQNPAMCIELIIVMLAG